MIQSQTAGKVDADNHPSLQVIASRRFGAGEEV